MNSFLDIVAKFTLNGMAWADICEGHWEEQFQRIHIESPKMSDSSDTEVSTKKNKRTKKVHFSNKTQIKTYEWISPVGGFQTPQEHIYAIHSVRNEVMMAHCFLSEDEDL